MPDEIVIRRWGRTGWSLTIDGEEFSWPVAIEPPAEVLIGDVPKVRLTLMARRVDLQHDLKGPA